MSAHPVLDLWQFRLSDGPGRPLGGLALETGLNLPVIELFDSRGVAAGVVLGHPIDLEAMACLSDRWDAPASCEEADSFVSSVFQALAGRFVLILDLEGARRIYPDAGAQIPIVFDETSHRVGSTAHALFRDDDYEARFDVELYERLEIEKAGWFPAGLTAHRDLSRLLPNHFLDLESWTVRRHWRPGPTALTPGEAVQEIIKTVTLQTEALHRSGRRIAQALTAGRETRMLLGIAGADSHRRDFVTITGGGQYSVDGVVAGRIARLMGLGHRNLPQIRATDDQRARYLRRGGNCVADANAWYFPSVGPIAETHVFIGGAGGEVGRGFFWKQGDHAEMPLDAERLATRFGLPREPELLLRLERWLAGLEGAAVTEVLDLAYLEHRVGPWGGAQFCSDPTLLRLAPLLSRRGIDAMLSLPESWKRSEGMGKAVIAATWPELETIPYNSAGPMQDLWAKYQRIVQDPGRAIKAIRKRWS